jgi:ring-1,2-phenylacetyl-CoA epoxidase subunit PaaE
VRAIIATLLPVGSMDEVFICGPEAMIEATESALLEAGVPRERVHTERFTSPTLDSLTPDARKAAIQSHAPVAEGSVALTVVLDGKPHEMRMNPDQHVLDVALAAGLDLPYSCRGGVCCTCRAKVLEGQVQMDRNFTLEAWETDKGFVLSCQARPTSERAGGELRRALKPPPVQGPASGLERRHRNKKSPAARGFFMSSASRLRSASPSQHPGARGSH